MRRKMIPAGVRGVGGRLCPWSRCLTWAKPAKQPPRQGRDPGCKPGHRGQRGGDRRRQGRSTGAICPLKQTTSYTFPLTTSFVCLSFLSPQCPPPLTSKVLQSVFVLFPFSLFVCFSSSSFVAINTLYTLPSHISPNSLYLPFLAVSLSHCKPPSFPPAPIFSGR